MIKKQKMLVTVKKWFIAPDNRLYHAVYGELKDCRENVTVIGNVYILNDQIITMIESDHCFSGETSGSWDFTVKERLETYDTPCQIYFTPEGEEQ